MRIHAGWAYWTDVSTARASATLPESYPVVRAPLSALTEAEPFGDFRNRGWTPNRVQDVTALLVDDQGVYIVSEAYGVVRID